ncbi:hypothetical protein KKE60_06750 [Patescibacteria group bacterium]|nr:hypothetical protein [Patescibacteria group bacterium]
MTQQIINYDEKMVGANHPTLSDTLNRAILVDHADDGHHNFAVLQEQGSAPTTAANEGAIYTKESGGVTELFFRRESDGIEIFMSTGFRLRQRTIYTSNDTWTKSAWCRAVLIEVQGGGGGSGGAGSGTGRGSSGGGGGGAYSKKFILESSLGATETVTVGGGGSGGAAGNNNGASGGTSSFGAHATSTGGGGGGGTTIGTSGFGSGGSGGTSSGGDICVNGGSGGTGIVLSSGTVNFGTGGGSLFSNPQNLPAVDGVDFGGGASGVSSATQVAGNDGGDGIIIVWEYE